MSRVKYFLILALFVAGIILVIGIKERFDINREIINDPSIKVPIMYSSFDNSPPGTINKVYGIHSLNREAAINYCKSIPKKDVNGYILFIRIYYPFVEENSYTGSYFEYYLKDCEDLPKQSICIDENNCLIKYGDGS